MDRFLLTFRRKETEEEYTRWVLEHDLRKLDLEFLCLAVGLCLAGTVRFAVQFVSWHHTPVMAFGAAQFAWAAVAWRRMTTGQLMIHRTAMVFRARILMLIVTWVIDINESPVSVTSLLSVCLCDGIFDAILLAWGLRLKFQQHLPYQVTSTLVMMFLSTKEQCAKLMESSGGSSVAPIAHRLDSMASRIMFTMFGWCTNEPIHFPCLHVLAWLHVFGIVIVQTYMLWKLERQSRLAFIQSLPRQRRTDEGLVVQCMDNVYMQLMHVFLLTITFAVTWEAARGAAGVLNEWGM